VSSKDVKVTVTGDTLTLRGERKREEKKTDGAHRIERSYGSFERSFTLGQPVRTDQVKASTRTACSRSTCPRPTSPAA